MRHRRSRRTLGIKTGHRKALLRNMVRSLVLYKRIETTWAKAKEVSATMDHLIQIAKRGQDLHTRRLLISKLGSARVAHMILQQIAPHFKERQGGYTRVLRLGTRAGDGAQKALLEFTALIEAPKSKKPKKEKKPKATTKPETPAVEKEEKKEKTKTKEAVKSKDAAAKQQEPESPADKKEGEKKGGFLQKLRKFLKGDEQ